MKLIKKIDNLFTLFHGQLKIFYFKKLLGKNFKIGIKPILKSTSRINIWDHNGNIIIGDFFSMGYNSEVYCWNNELRIGHNTSMNDNCKIYGSVSIGTNCLLASNIFISSGTHNFLYQSHLPIKYQDKLQTTNREIIVEDDCWLGFGVVVMPGVYIGKGAVVGSNSVVTKDVFPYTINAGIPNREIGKRLEFRNSFNELNATKCEHWPYFYKGCSYKQFEDPISLKEGIDIIDSTAIFLVSKNVTSKLKLKGFCSKKIKLKVYLNKNYFTNLSVNKGFFDTSLNLVFQNLHRSMAFEKLSDNLANEFSIIVIEAYTDDGIHFNKDIWKVLSIGYNEN